MRVDFFEEYPSEDTMRSAASISWPARVFLATPSLTKFHAYAAQLRAANPALEPAYWPTLTRSYWVSPFSRRDDLVQLEHELANYTGEPLAVLLDLELPLLAPRLFLQQSLAFRGNRQVIKRILALTTVSIYTAEYPFSPRLLRWCGVSYSGTHRRLPMFYRSMIAQYDYFGGAIQRHLWRGMITALASGEIAQVGLGTIARGALGNEPILPPAELGEDVRTARLAGAERVTIFRLGGITESYIRAIQEAAAFT